MTPRATPRSMAAMERPDGPNRRGQRSASHDARKRRAVPPALDDNLPPKLIDDSGRTPLYFPLRVEPSRIALPGLTIPEEVSLGNLHVNTTID